MRIGLVVENDAPFVAEEVAALRARGLAVDVASVFRPLPAERWFEAYAGPVAYPAPGFAGWAAAARPALAAPLRALELVHRARFEGAPLRLVALAASLARRARRSGWTHLHASFATFPAFTAAAAARLAGLPFSFTAHAYDVQMPRPWLRRLIGEAAFVRAISEEGAARLRALVEPPSRGRVRVGRLGVDVDRFAPRPGRRAVPAEVVCVAQLGPTKGIDVLLEAAARLEQEGVVWGGLAIVGDGPLRVRLEALAARLGLADRVRFAGRASREGVRDVLAAASVFALPCVELPGGRHDGLPVALLEAMATGLPVVTTPVGGIPEAVESGRNGWLVRPGDAGALARRLRGLLSDPDARERMGAAARATVLERFRAEDSAARLADWMAAFPVPSGARTGLADRPAVRVGGLS